MNGLYRYTRHLLRDYEAQEGLPQSQIDVEDIVDAAVLETYSRWEPLIRRVASVLGYRMEEIGGCRA